MPMTPVLAFSVDANQLSAQQAQVDTNQLTDIVNQCFLASMDGRFTQEQRGQFLAFGAGTREQLRMILGKVFENATTEVNQANSAITAVNKNLKSTIEDLSHIANTIEQLGRLVAVLDALIKMAGMVF